MRPSGPGGYRLVEYTADTGCEVTASSFEDLACYALKALYEIAGLKKTAYPGRSTVKSFRFRTEEKEDVLMEIIREALWLLSEKNTIITRIEPPSKGKIDVRILRKKEQLPIRVEIKALTYHGFSVTGKSGNFAAKMLFDI